MSRPAPRAAARRRRCRAALVIAALLCPLAWGCEGKISSGPSDGPLPAGSVVAGGGGDGLGAGGVSGSQDPGGPGDPRIVQRIWRLTPDQLNAEIERLFGPGAPSIALPEAASEYGITNVADNGVIDQGNLGALSDGVRAVAGWVVSQREATTRCTSYGSDGCVDELLAWLPASAFRRAVGADETAELRALFDDLSASYDHDYALGGLVRAVLLSPDFLYRTELGEGSELLSNQEIANLMAFSITDAAPDDALLGAADRGELTDPDARETQARRLMALSERSWQRFFWEWLQMSTLYSQGEEVGLEAELVQQMQEEYEAFVREVVVTGRGSLRDLLSAPYTFVRPELATLYGADHPGGGLARVELDPVQRGGLLTQGAWLVSHGKRGRDNVVRRGMNIFKSAMCNNNLAPPDGLDVQAELAKLVGPDATVRETVEARAESPTCGACHAVPDPVGMVFESYTSDARWQDFYPSGTPVDTNISVAGIGDFDNARAFSTALADDLPFQRCFVRRYLHYLTGIDLGSPGMVLWSQQAHEALMASGTSLEELLVAVVRHPAFIERRTEVSP